jgi:hypothetical protein
MSLLAASVALLVLPPLLIKVLRILGGFGFLYLVATLLLLLTTLSPSKVVMAVGVLE